MHKTKPIAESGWKLGLVVLVLVLLGGSAASASNHLIVKEGFDTPAVSAPGGWGDETVPSVTREFVDEGVGGSMAAQMSATLVDNAWVTLCLFQSGAMGGNELATRANTVLSFDIKIDRPGMTHVVGFLDGFEDYLWGFYSGSGATMCSVGAIPVGKYKPGVFKQIVVALDDPLWVQNQWPDPDNMLPLFEPTAKTYNNIALTLESACLPGEGERPVTITVDNVQVSTKNQLVSVVGGGAAEVGLNSEGTGYLSTERGYGAHFGNYEMTVSLPFTSPVGWAELTAANGDQLSGPLFFAGLDMAIEFVEGTGRFKGVTGSLRSELTWNATFTSWTSDIQGCLSTVGANKR